MITSLSDQRYLKVQHIWRETFFFLPCNPREIARYILSCANEYLVFSCLNNTALFDWNKSSLQASSVALVFFDDLQGFMDRVSDALSKEKRVCPKIYCAVTPFQDSYICLCPQKDAGEQHYSFLSMRPQAGKAFEKLMRQLGIDFGRFASEVLFLLCGYYVGDNLPAPRQFLEYGQCRFHVTFGQDNSGSYCIFDIS